MTNRAIVKLQEILIEVSAQKGAYIASKINLKISSSKALRLIDQMSLPFSKKVNVLGIDDWAIRKGSTYGTILVDNETKRSDLKTSR
jgi:transposase